MRTSDFEHKDILRGKQTLTLGKRNKPRVRKRKVRHKREIMLQPSPTGIQQSGMQVLPLVMPVVVQGSPLAALGPTPYDRLENIHYQPVTQDVAAGPAPLTDAFTGILTAGEEKVQSHNCALLLNKLCQRLAFERAGVRLYEALILKCEAAREKGAHPVLSIQKLRQFRDEELAHFLLLKRAMVSLGADPSTLPGEADTGAQASLGVQRVLNEPRSSVLQCLEAILTTELTDNAAWCLLKELCLNMGLKDLADEFTDALAQEEVHAAIIAEWVRLMTMTQGNVKNRKRRYMAGH
ncbi:MAG: ferritin-like domain-containing protein [Halomonadaceae bacterium]|nr:MAG: ferritin-like domain-containing protein [Halomonadaceae bacterium]